VLEDERVKDSTIHNDRSAFGGGESEFLHQLPFELTGAGIKQRSKGLPDGALIADIGAARTGLGRCNSP
jgi:hypothetical protein